MDFYALLCGFRFFSRRPLGNNFDQWQPSGCISNSSRLILSCIIRVICVIHQYTHSLSYTLLYERDFFLAELRFKSGKKMWLHIKFRIHLKIMSSGFFLFDKYKNPIESWMVFFSLCVLCVVCVCAAHPNSITKWNSTIKDKCQDER